MSRRSKGLGRTLRSSCCTEDSKAACLEGERRGDDRGGRDRQGTETFSLGCITRATLRARLLHSCICSWPSTVFVFFFSWLWLKGNDDADRFTP